MSRSSISSKELEPAGIVLLQTELEFSAVCVSYNTEADVEMILQRARERFPNKKPRIISDNGPQFIAKDFKEFIRISGTDHVRISPYYPQSNGN